MRYIIISCIIIIQLLAVSLSEDVLSTPFIAFGSCNRQNKNQQFWSIIKQTNPSLFLWTGDAVYAKNNTLHGLTVAYKKLTENTDYINFVKELEIDGIWDDHDMGVNDGGKNVNFLKERKELFEKYIRGNIHLKNKALDKSNDIYSNAAADDDIKNSGERNEKNNEKKLYKSIEKRFPDSGAVVNFIMLDTRSHRDNHYIRSIGEFKFPLFPMIAAAVRGTYTMLGLGRAYDGDMLGESQWLWLESILKNSKADFHIIISSIQILTSNPVVESWGHFPISKNKLFLLLQKYDPKGFFFVSGDVHHGEISRAIVKRENSEKNRKNVKNEKNEKHGNENGNKDENINEINGLDNGDGYSFENLLEFTASGLTHTCGDSKINQFLCPLMLKTFSSHRLPIGYNDDKNSIENKNNKDEKENNKNDDEENNDDHNHDDNNNDNNINDNKHMNSDNYFIGKNFGLISDVSNFNESSRYSLNVSIVNIDNGRSMLSYVIHSYPDSNDNASTNHNNNTNDNFNDNTNDDTDKNIDTTNSNSNDLDMVEIYLKNSTENKKDRHYSGNRNKISRIELSEFPLVLPKLIVNNGVNILLSVAMLLFPTLILVHTHLKGIKKNRKIKK